MTLKSIFKLDSNFMLISIAFLLFSTQSKTIQEKAPIPTENHPKSENPTSQPFSLQNWTLQLPIGIGSKFETVKHPILTQPGDGFVFHTPVLPLNGVSSANSDFTRTELREMNATNPKYNANWDTVTGVHFMKVTQSIDKISSSTEGKLINFQIHSECCAVMTVRLFSKPETGVLLFADFDKFENGSLTKIIGADKYPLIENYVMGTKFDLEVVVDNGLVYVYLNGELKTPKEGYKTNLLGVYFKAGSYSQNLPSETIPATAVNQVTIYKMELYHGDGPYTPPTPSSPKTNSNDTSVDDSPALNSANGYSFSSILFILLLSFVLY
ncbi:hypothetical protein HK099_005079 [Clydaea vesicula]|uniref:Alginate lyase 2 domain-containing protein n=1 Tax=Clydaea vesicula TaxID=447962 RepID=A0AAD5TZT9_9FUNG|nr:hypothetical protein HK099_005079 [Clydaea vesicula]